MSLALVSTPEIEAFLAKALQCPGHEVRHILPQRLVPQSPHQSLTPSLAGLQIPASQAQEGEVDWATLKAAAAGVRCGCPGGCWRHRLALLYKPSQHTEIRPCCCFLPSAKRSFQSTPGSCVQHAPPQAAGPRDKRWTSKKYAEAAGSPSRLHANVRSLRSSEKSAVPSHWRHISQALAPGSCGQRVNQAFLPMQARSTPEGCRPACVRQARGGCHRHRSQVEDAQPVPPHDEAADRPGRSRRRHHGAGIRPGQPVWSGSVHLKSPHGMPRSHCALPSNVDCLRTQRQRCAPCAPVVAPSTLALTPFCAATQHASLQAQT